LLQDVGLGAHFLNMVQLYLPENIKRHVEGPENQYSTDGQAHKQMIFIAVLRQYG
jgi:hypothetical protein